MSELLNCSREAWDEFARHSPEATVYSSSEYLQCLPGAVEYLQYQVNGRPVAGIAASTDNDRLVPVYANGIHFATELDEEIRFDASRAIGEWIRGRFKKAEIICHWNLLDVRAFEDFEVRVRYTSLLKLDTNVSENADKMRLRNLKSAEREGLSTATTTDFEVLRQLHRLTFERQGIQIAEDEELQLMKVCERLCAAGSADLYVTSNRSGQPLSAALIGRDRHRGYYIYGGTDPESRNTGAGTKIFFDVFQHVRDNHGLKEIDFVGANSPGRGSFKLSFGGELVPYFAIRKP
ncbi:MAG: GNAT family N-acetyltransferase [Bdellovibrionota bacterium]